VIIQCELQILFTGFSNAHDGHCLRALTAFGSGSFIKFDSLYDCSDTGVCLDLSLYSLKLYSADSLPYWSFVELFASLVMEIACNFDWLFNSSTYESVLHCMSLRP
jgi:hypothetical protein